MALTLKSGLVGAIAYTLSVDGEVLETVDAAEALEYLHGAENIVPGLEAALEGKQAGDRFNITLAPEDAYGEYDPEEVEDIDLNKFLDVDELQPGLEVEIMDDKGDFFEATVLEVGQATVKLDFNPPLAGKTLTYEGQIIDVREATEEELEIGFPASMIEMMEDEDFDDDDDHDHGHHHHHHH